MKTRKFVLTLVLFVIAIGTTHAQTNYYTTTHVIQRNGYTYQCDLRGDSVIELYNSTNSYTDVDQTLKDGTWVDNEYFFQDTFGADWREKRNLAQQLTHQVFTAAELQSFQNPAGQFLWLSLYVDPDTGRVIEVSFDFSNRFNYAKIPIEKYRQIELAIKNNVTFQISEAGKKLNFCFTHFKFDPTPVASGPGLTGIDYRIISELPDGLSDIRVELYGTVSGQSIQLISSSASDMPGGWQSASYSGNTFALPPGTVIGNLQLRVYAKGNPGGITRITARIGSYETVNIGDIGGGSEISLGLGSCTVPFSGRNSIDITVSVD